ncbi:hypothetical protein J6X96_06565 [bacterium]|nr:hypothetical protein [bacterium]
MKRFLLLALLLALTSSLMAETLFEENFESYEAGTEMVGTIDGWDTFSTYGGSSTIVENESGIAGKSMKMQQIDGGSADYDMIFGPKFDMSTEDSLRQLVRVSATVVPSSETDIMALYAVNGETNRFAYLHMNVAKGELTSYPTGATLTNLNKDNTPNRISMLWDNYDNTIRQITCNGQTQDCHIAMSGSFYAQPVRIRFSTQFGTRKDWVTYYDDVKVETESRYAAPHLFIDKTSLTLKKKAQGHLTLQNAGPEGDITFAITKSEGADWLTVSPSSGTYNGTKDLTFSTTGDKDYARAKVTIDAGTAGTEVVSVYWVNGTVFYREDFEEPFMTMGDLQNQEGWLVRSDTGSSSNRAEIEKPEFAESQVMHAYRSTGYDGVRKGGRPGSTPIEGCPALSVVKVSGRIYWESTSNAGSIYLATPDTAKPFCMKIRKTDGQNTFYLYQMRDGSYTPPDAFSGKTWPMDEWVYVSYTIDFATMKGVEVQIGDVTADISNYSLYDVPVKAFTGLSFCTDKASGGDDWDAKFYFDDIQCEYIPRGDEPIMGIDDDTFHTGLTAESGEVTLVNAGGGSFDYSASVIMGGSWLSIAEPTSGTCEDEAKIVFNIDREALNEDYYRGVISLDCGSCGSTNILVTAGAGHIIYKEDFEEPFMQVGDLQGQDAWVVRGTNCADSNEAYVVDAHDTHCMHAKRAQGYDGIRNNSLSGCPENQIVKFSYRIYWDDQSEAQSVYLATPAGIKPFCMKIRRKDDGTFYLYQMLDGSYQPPLDGYSWSMNEWIDISYTLDFRSQNGVTVQIGEDAADISSLVLYGNGSYKKLEGFSFCTDGSGNEFDSLFYFDDFKMEIIDRDPDPKLNIATPRVVVGLTAESGEVMLNNSGAGSFEWTATLPDDPSWLELTTASGTCQKDDPVRFKVLRDEMESDYYRTVMHIDAGAAGEADVIICVCSGSVFYKEDFEEPYMHIGDLQGQDGWVVRNGGYCRDVNSAYVTNGLPFTDNACMHTVVSKGIDGTTRDYVSTCPRDARVKVSMDVYWDSASPCDAVYLACPIRHKPMTLKIENKGDGTFGVRGMQDDSYKVMVGKTWSMDEWVHISYSMDFRTQTGVELTIGEETEDITQVELYGTHHTYEGFSFCTDGDDEMDSLFYFDNLVFEIVPKEDKPHPVMPGATAVSTDDSATVKVLNYGTPYDFSISVLDLPGNVSVSPKTGRTEDSTELTFTVNRGELDDNFYRTRVCLSYSDGVTEGALTSLVTFAVGGWYYGADFLGPWFGYGPLNGQESWTANSSEVEIINLDGENAIKYPFACSTEVGAKVPLDGIFTFSARVYSEELADDSYFRIGTVDGAGYYPMYISREGDPRELQFGYFSGNTWTPIATAPFGQWVDFSFTMDTNPEVACIKEITFDDFVTNFIDGELPLNPSYDGKRIEKFTINLYDVANPAGMYMSRIVVKDPAVPEPAILALLALVGMLLVRKAN